jgi:hypothetical protein
MRGNAWPERDELSSNPHPGLAFCLRMIFSENRFPLFGIMLERRRRRSYFIPSGMTACRPSCCHAIGAPAFLAASAGGKSLMAT